MSFINDFSRLTYIYFIMKKSELFDNLLEFKDLVENQTKKRNKVSRTTNGGMF